MQCLLRPAAPAQSSVRGLLCQQARRSLSTRKAEFRLDRDFVSDFKHVAPPFGFNGLGELVYQRTYSRIKNDGSNEAWFETVERVVNGVFTMQKNWIETHQLGWDEKHSRKQAEEMYLRIFQMKFLPPGRGLWAMGSAITEERGLYAALNNCAFVSTDTMADQPSKPFMFLMDAAMLGVGVGFDTKGAGTVVVQGVDQTRPKAVFQIPDSREGWVESIQLLIDSHFLSDQEWEFDYSLIRPAGMLIRGFGGVSSGAEPLKELHEALDTTLRQNQGRPVSVTTIVDLMNLIGKCVVSGNVRRTAEIAFGDPHSSEYIDLKNYGTNPHRMSYGWTSNNSVFAPLGMDYGPVVQRVVDNGEPGFAWLHNMQNYGRMNGVVDRRDARAQGGNPCLEQTLESYEMCCLVETFPYQHDTLEDFQRSLQMAYLYAKTVTLGPTHWPETNRVMLRNRRIGCSISGVAQFVSKHGLNELRHWCEEGYTTVQEADATYSDWLAIPRSIKTTCVKPSGSVSLLAGATPGMHYPESRFYTRRVRLNHSSPLLEPLVDAGYHVEPAVGDEKNTSVVEIPVDAGEGLRSVSDMSMWEQLALAAFLQRHWADNQVSSTITFDPQTEGPQLQHALDFFQYQLKGVSFLPKLEKKAYPQMPYEAITQEEYEQRSQQLKTLDLAKLREAGRVAAPSQDGVEKEADQTESQLPEGISPTPSATEATLQHLQTQPVPDMYCDSDRCINTEFGFEVSQGAGENSPKTAQKMHQGKA